VNEFKLEKKMKTKIFVLICLSLMSASAFAEVKPKGTVLSRTCGNQNRSVQICHSSADLNGQQYIHIYRFDSQQDLYIPAVLTKETTLGAEVQKLVGKIVKRDPASGYSIEHEYQFIISRPVIFAPNERRYISGTLLIDGVQEGPAFPVSPISHTENVTL
jgi:hypothetical protein